MITASQSFRIYEILFRHFKNDADAKELVSEIENVIETRFQSEKERLSTKEDIAKLETKIEEKFKDQLKWLIILMFGFSTMIITVIKLL